MTRSTFAPNQTDNRIPVRLKGLKPPSLLQTSSSLLSSRENARNSNRNLRLRVSCSSHRFVVVFVGRSSPGKPPGIDGPDGSGHELSILICHRCCRAQISGARLKQVREHVRDRARLLEAMPFSLDRSSPPVCMWPPNRRIEDPEE
jgi:hypothetical protein